MEIFSPISCILKYVEVFERWTCYCLAGSLYLGPLILGSVSIYDHRT